tara:strand:- start:1619 stop:1741 length:123 start_codon:yes stop_codon:yes gene_type:complete
MDITGTMLDINFRCSANISANIEHNISRLQKQFGMKFIKV